LFVEAKIQIFVVGKGPYKKQCIQKRFFYLLVIFRENFSATFAFTGKLVKAR